MADKDQKASKLLNRAYSLETEADSKALYGDWADTYDETMMDGMGYLTPTKTAELLARRLPNSRALILDVGAGTGLAGVELSRLGYLNMHAIDYSAEMLSVAERRGIYEKLIEADLNDKLDVGANCYDAIICTGTFTHAHVGAQCLDELFRILKPGGIFACTIHKDVWEPAGFKKKVPELEQSGLLRTVSKKSGIYFSNSTEEEGWYIVWEKT